MTNSEIHMRDSLMIARFQLLFQVHWNTSELKTKKET